MTVVPLYEYCGMFGTDKGHTWSCSNGDRLTVGRVYLSFNILFKTLFVYVCFFYQAMERRRKRLKAWLTRKFSRSSKQNLMIIIIEFTSVPDCRILRINVQYLSLLRSLCTLCNLAMMCLSDKHRHLLSFLPSSVSLTITTLATSCEEDRKYK